jgi:hypothetical protein
MSVKIWQNNLQFGCEPFFYFFWVQFKRIPNEIITDSLLTYSMEHSPSWEANQSLQLVKKFITFLWKLKVLYGTHKCLPPVSVVSQLHPVPTTPSNNKFLSCTDVMKVNAGSTEHYNPPCSYFLSVISFWSMGSVFCLLNIGHIPLLFQFAISWGPHIVFQWTVVNIGVLVV